MRRESIDTTADQGYLRCGDNGAGHFVKMVHNGIEYGVTAAYAEGLAVLHRANVGLKPSLADAETTPLRNPQYYRYDFDFTLPFRDGFWKGTVSMPVAPLFAGVITSELLVTREQRGSVELVRSSNEFYMGLRPTHRNEN